MRLATKLRGKPQTGARPTIKRRSGKPLKKRPKKPSTSPAVNQAASVAVAIRGVPPGFILRWVLIVDGEGQQGFRERSTSKPSPEGTAESSPARTRTSCVAWWNQGA